MSVLYIVATPIGNLSDLSQRAIETLEKVDFILCEDTRRTAKLLSHFKISVQMISYHQHSKLNKVEHIIELLEQGRDLALVSDAGTPGISDPGGKLIEEILVNPKLTDKNKIIPIPGPSALATAASIANFPMDRFLFLGFPPTKNKRSKFFQEIADSKYPVIIYESCHRILKTLSELPKNRQIVVCQELTKLHETIFRGTVEQILKQLETAKIKGEFVIVISQK